MTMLQRLTYTVEEAGDLLGISRGSAYNLVPPASSPPCEMARRLLVSRVALKDLLGQAPPPPGKQPERHSPGHRVETATKLRAHGQSEAIERAGARELLAPSRGKR